MLRCMSCKSGTPAWWFAKRDLDQFGDLNCLHVSQLALKLSSILSFMPLILTGLTFLILPPPELGFHCNCFCHSTKDDRVMQDSWDSTAGRKQVSDARTAAASAALIGQEAWGRICRIYFKMLQSLGHLRFVGPDWPADSDSDSRLWWDLCVGWWKGPVSIIFKSNSLARYEISPRDAQVASLPCS